MSYLKQNYILVIHDSPAFHVKIVVNLCRKHKGYNKQTLVCHYHHTADDHHCGERKTNFGKTEMQSADGLNNDMYPN